MEAPPPYPMPPVQKSNNKLIWGIVIGVVSLCCIGVIALGFFGYKFVGKIMPIAICEVKLRDVRQAIRQYAAEHAGKLPNAKTWEDDIKPQLAKLTKSSGEDNNPVIDFRTGEQLGCKYDTATTGIAFNSDLSGKKLDDIQNKTMTVLIYEVPTATHNASGPYKLVTGIAPKVMNMDREWFTVPVEGHIQLSMNGKSVDMEKNQGDE